MGSGRVVNRSEHFLVFLEDDNREELKGSSHHKDDGG